MVELAQIQDGFIGIESTRNEIGITVSYWKNLESIKKWRENSEHTTARETARNYGTKAIKSVLLLWKETMDFNYYFCLDFLQQKLQKHNN